MPPVSFECLCRELLDIGPGQVIAVGEIVTAHVGDAFVAGTAPLRLDTLAMDLIARMHGADEYLRTTGTFALARAPYDPARLGEPPSDPSR